MPFTISAGVLVTEQDQTGIIPSVSTTVGAFAGVFSWGPVNEATLVGSEKELVQRFLSPNANNIETFFTAANFLSYTNALYVSRAVDANSFNAAANTGSYTPVQIQNYEAYLNATLPDNVLYLARYPGSVGNSLRVSICDSANAYSSNTSAPANANNTASFNFQQGTKSGTLTVTNSAGSNTDAETDATTISNLINLNDFILIGNSTIGTQYVKVVSKSSGVATANGVVTINLTLDRTVSLSSNAVSNTVNRKWEFFNQVSAAPGTSTFVAAANGQPDELHVFIVDEDGKFSGVNGNVLEKYEAVSRATDAKAPEGGSIYYKNVINGGSAYVLWAGDNANAVSNTAANIIASTNRSPLSISFVSGTDPADESSISIGSITNAFSVFQNAADIDISLVLTGKTRGGVEGEQIANWLIDNVAEDRKDCVVFASPEREAVVNNKGSEATSIVAWANQVSVSSYAFLDSGYKYQYDRYNDQYVYVPLNGDMAGLAARTDLLADPWFSPAGFNRGQIKNVVKLAYNPSDSDDRDLLYSASVNPVVVFPGQGTVLFGDKTHLVKPSAFDRINVRRLFIVMEKAIAIAAKYELFEFNDAVTQAQFRNMVDPYLRDIQGRRGIKAYKVICDDSNNPDEVVNADEFVGSIYVQPARSINFINLVFTAVNSIVNFTETVGTVPQG